MAFTPLNALNAFVAVARRRSYAAAAKDLGVSTSALSQSVSQLEARLGVTLLARTSRSVALTEAGQRLLEQAGPAVDQALESLRSVKAKPGEITGRVRLTVPSVAVSLVLGRVLPRFVALHPKVEVDVRAENRLADIVSEGFDAGIRLIESIDRDMVHVRLTPPNRIVVVASPAYLERRGVPQKPADLLRHDCIGMRWDTNPEAWSWELGRGKKTWRVPVRGPVTTNDFELMRVLALAGVGLLYAFESTVEAELARGELQIVLEPYSPDVPGLFLYFPSRAQVSPALKAFVEVARAVTQEPPPRSLSFSERPIRNPDVPSALPAAYSFAMPTIPAWGVTAAGKPLAPLTIERREPGPRDVVLEILFCGVCHSDIHQAKDEWGNGSYPMVPGHEIIGRVVRVGSGVTKLAVGDIAGVGCLVDSCHACGPCKDDFEQFCEKGAALTYNGTEMDRTTPTQGGYSSQIVLDERFALRVPAGLDPAGAAPLLCAGITTYSPLRRWGIKPGDRVGVVGLGGLGHMGVKLAVSMGAHVTVLSTSTDKEADARRLGASDFLVTKDAAFAQSSARFDFLLDTVSAPHDYNAYLGLLRPRGAMVLVGAPSTPSSIHAFSLILGGKQLAGSMIGGIAETQEMLDHCAKHNIVSDIELIGIQGINEAYERVLKSDVRYRFVIDMASLRPTG